MYVHKEIRIYTSVFENFSRSTQSVRVELLSQNFSRSCNFFALLVEIRERCCKINDTRVLCRIQYTSFIINFSSQIFIELRICSFVIEKKKKEKEKRKEKEKELKRGGGKKVRNIKFSRQIWSRYDSQH